MSPENAPQGRGRDPGTYLLNSLIAVVFLAAVAMAVAYAVPPEHLVIPQEQITIRVARQANFPVGSSRIETWGDLAILVVRRAESEYAALQAVSPVDGCLLRWDADAMRVVSPCGHVVYNLRGHAVEGLTTEPLHRYTVFVRDGIVYVTRG